MGCVGLGAQTLHAIYTEINHNFEFLNTLQSLRRNRQGYSGLLYTTEPNFIKNCLIVYCFTDNIDFAEDQPNLYLLSIGILC